MDRSAHINCGILPNQPKPRNGLQLPQLKKTQLSLNRSERLIAKRPGAYDLPKWVKHPDKQKLAMYIQPEDFMGSRRRHNFQGFNVAHIGAQAELQGILGLYLKSVVFLDVYPIWHLEGFGSMENTSTGCADDLPEILKSCKNDPKSRSVNILSAAEFCPKQYKRCYLPAKAPPSQLYGKSCSVFCLHI